MSSGGTMTEGGAWLAAALAIAAGTGCTASACAQATATTSSPSDTPDAWAVGYAVLASSLCPAFEMTSASPLVSLGLLAADDDEPEPADPALRDYRRGQDDAITDAREHEHFCRDLRTIAGDRWTRLSFVLGRAHQAHGRR